MATPAAVRPMALEVRSVGRNSFETWWPTVVLAILLVCTWGPNLSRGFWVDEAGTYWMSHEGPLAAITKTWAWPGQSILYSVIASFFTLSSGPLREIVLRLPSLAGMAAASFFLFRLAESLLGAGVGFAAVVLFLFNPLSIEMGTEARPYALALAAVAGSFWYLATWLADRSYRSLALYVTCSVLIVYLHYLFAAVLAVHVLVAGHALLFGNRRRAWQLGLAWTCAALLTAPLWPHLRLLAREAHTLPFTPHPRWPDFLWEVWTPLLLFGLALAGLMVSYWRGDRFVSPPAQEAAPSRTAIVMMAGWWLLVPAIFWATSVFTSARPFVPRYISFCAEAMALVLACVGARIFDRSALTVWVLLGVALTTGSPGRILSLRHPGQEELRPVLQIIAAESRNSQPPVFFSSELPESVYYNWRAGLSPDSYLYAPFVAYPMKNRLVPLPYLLTPEVKEYMNGFIDGDLRKEDKIVFITHRESWNQWVIERMAKAGYHARLLAPNTFFVIVFERDRHS